ncbi:PAS domain-containing protein [Thalassotalea sediminis]|uniref:PAS domain-containing protein n=1 Tax=Thalassotalea sediminis TaxID=1759089 RepID=UPI00257236A0|nr:PAS domain-containing protein [Thalassotalea sediminis]
METNTLSSFFRGDYMPHGHCYLWQPHILWTNVISDFLIAVAYFSLPVAIMLFSAKRQDIGFRGVFVLFSLFILFCGITHVFGILTIWHGIYGIHGVSKAITALVSVITAVYVYKLMPTAITLPTIAQFEDVKEQLTANKATVDELESQLVNQKLVQFILNSIPVSTLMLNNRHRIVFYNQTFTEEYNDYIHCEALGLSLFDFVSLEHDIHCDVETFLASHKYTNNEKLVVNGTIPQENGEVVPIELSLDKAEFEGEFVTLIAIKNLTAFTEIKQELVESHNRLERAISATEDGIWEWDVVNDRVEYSPKLMELIDKEEIKTPCFQDWFSHIHPDHQSAVQQAIEQHFIDKKQYAVEYLGVGKNQKYSWFVSVGNSTFDAEGKPLIMSGSLRNIDALKKLERLNQEQTDFLNTIYYGSRHAIWVLTVMKDGDFRYEQFNDTACAWTNTTQEHVIGKSLTALTGDIFPESVAKKVRFNYEKCVDTKSPVDFVESYEFDNEPLWYSTTLYPILDANNQVATIVATAIDVTQQKRSEKALEENQSFLQTIINSTVCGLYLFDVTKNTNITVNQRYTDLLGYTIHDINAEKDFLKLFHPEDLEQVQGHISSVINEQNNNLIPITYRFKHKDGHWVWCYSVDCIVKRDETGAPQIMLGTFVDITEQTSLLQKLKESNAYLERFAFVASHDLQEPLRKIIAFSRLLQERLSAVFEKDEEANYELTRLVNAAERMQTMIKDILKLSRINTTAINIIKCDLTSIINDAKDRLSFLIEQKDVVINVTTEPVDLYADPALLTQVFQNLIANAIKFAKIGQQPIINISLKEISESTVITVADNGIGIKEQYFTQIFEPFRKLHSISEYEGSGIGLAICQQILKVHEGHISCDSDQEQGTTFTLSLPKQGAKYV